jgi:shikimate dehydrogenase
VPRLAVLGQPISHSRSPAIHTAALAELGLASEWSYEAIEVGPPDFATLVASLAAAGFAGVNVTVPHKLAALALADRASVAAREIGAANTLTFSAGAVAADNTDSVGLIAALPEAPQGKRALVLGAGGSARACIWALRQAGAEVAIWNRTGSKAQSLARELGATPISARGQLPIEDFDLLVNATTVGLDAANPASQADAQAPGALKALPIDADAISERQVVVDLVYGSVPTPLISAARSRGACVVDGLEILVCQGAASLRLWTGLEPPLETMRQAALAVTGNER